MTGSSTTGRKYHRPSARDRAWIAFVVHGCSADGVVACARRRACRAPPPASVIMGFRKGGVEIQGGGGGGPGDSARRGGRRPRAGATHAGGSLREDGMGGGMRGPRA